MTAQLEPISHCEVSADTRRVASPQFPFFDLCLYPVTQCFAHETIFGVALGQQRPTIDIDDNPGHIGVAHAKQNRLGDLFGLPHATQGEIGADCV